MTNSPIQEFTYLSNQGLFTMTAHPEYKMLGKGDLDVKSFKYSPLGKYLVLVKQKCLQIYDGRQVNRLLREIPVEHLADISFSPKETYLTVWTRYTKPNDGETLCMNLNVWNIATGNKPLSFPQKVPAGWDVQWTEDESYCAKQTGSHIQIFDTAKFSNSAGISKLQIEGLSSFSLSPGKRPMISVFANSKGGPCFCKIYDLSNLKQPSAQKTFMRADSVTFNWNAIGTNLLVFTHTDVDVTGQSYYGETNLYYMSISGNFDCRVDLKQPGPIHDVTWAPNSKEFIVVYGSMPARATLFSHRAEPIYELGTGARNHVKYSPSGRFFFIGGFGNVQGDMDIWERKGFKKIATVNGSNSSVIEWSPDGRYLMTAILYKRLKVDNCIKMWHYTGVLAHKIESKEMLQVAWRPEAAHLWPEKCSVSPVPKAIEQEANTEVKKPVGKYVPPGMRAAQNSASLYDREAIDRDLASGSAISKGKNTPKPKKAPPQKKETVGAVAEGSIDLEKKIKNITKKLEQIEDLKLKMNSGELLELTQVTKIESQAKWEAELAALKEKLNTQ